ncbi:MAG TPA: UDP-N-acetylmuramate:L-alanyl-gamma-D-glutamyl-meso-diaminopimelate ligase [candidate division Zixibacteria bacterium]|nr:UDP-N-acetylmuramate:L-alanyl-gamma-D-glutamyl-meso-diaminopimelate ligase [candidate division Zixibacteria bacterium]
MSTAGPKYAGAAGPSGPSFAVEGDPSMFDAPPKGSHIHLIAVCGVGMASLAGLLQAEGYRVTGSDQNVYPPMSTYLAGVGIEVLPGFCAEHLVPKPDLVVVGNAVSRDNPEAQALLSAGIPYLSFPQALGTFLIGDRESLVVTGTHGKTTTTALAAWALTRAGFDPGFFVGGMPLNFGSGWSRGAGRHVVLEGDEYDSAFFDKGPKFLHYRPRHVILTSVEFDHADIYRDLDHLKSAFARLVDLIPADGTLVVSGDYPAALDVAGGARCRVITYGDGAEWSAAEIEAREGRSSFVPVWRGRREGRVELGMIGRHNVQNALAVYAVGRTLGLGHRTLAEGFAGFRGVKRRQELRGAARGVRLIDDFAHHPTAVRETIEAVRAAYPGARLWAVFEPRSNTSRRRVFEREFAAALGLADRVVLAAVHQPEKIPEGERLSVGNVVAAINDRCGEDRAVALAGADAIAAHVAANAAAGDIVLVMSNGGFDGVQDKILARLAA